MIVIHRIIFFSFVNFDVFLSIEEKDCHVFGFTSNLASYIIGDRCLVFVCLFFCLSLNLLFDSYDYVDLPTIIKREKARGIV